MFLKAPLWQRCSLRETHTLTIKYKLIGKDLLGKIYLRLHFIHSFPL